jgi:hypothetical protein
MAIENHGLRMRRSIEEQLGVEEAAYLIEGRPPGGWDNIVTKEYLDLRLDALSGQFHREVNRLILWLIPTVFGGLAAVGGIVAAVG